MRCLYCGKELALFKRITRGEFCSDAHRLSYQEEYTQLALNRLLQANAGAPASEPDDPASLNGKEESPARSRNEREAHVAEGDLSPAGARAKTAATATAAVPEMAHANGSARASVAAEEVPAKAPARNGQPARKSEPQPPAAPGFIFERPMPAAPGELSLARPETDPAFSRIPSLSFSGDARQVREPGVLLPAGPAAIPCPQADAETPLRKRGLEEREFVRSIPSVEVRLEPITDIGLTNLQQVLEVPVDPQTPPASPQLWQSFDCSFPARSMSPGALARLDFETTGWEPGGEFADAKHAEAETEEHIAIPAPAGLADLPQPQVSTEAQPLSGSRPAAFERSNPEPVHFEPVRIDPAFASGIFAEPEPEVATPASETAAAPAAPEPSAETEEASPVPGPITKPMPITLLGIAPGRAKATQVFTAALARLAEIQAPPQSALPLRPTLIFGPAEAPEVESKPPAVEAKPKEATKPGRAFEKPEQKFAPVRQTRKLEPRGPAVKAREEIKKQPEPEKKQEAAAELRAKPATAEPSKLSAAKAAPLILSDRDLGGLSTLSIEAGGSFLSKLPAAARLGLAAAVLALIGGGIFLITRGSGAAGNGSAGPVLVDDGPALASAGWVQDWFTDPAKSKLERHVDVLRGSLTLHDFRLEFEGQIEQQALGWVFRANNKSFYVEKLQIVKPGLDPQVDLVRFAVVDGNEQPRTQVPLPFKAALDTMYKVRLEAVGPHFVTYVQDQKVDDWTDNRFAAGGLGLYYESGDSAKLKDTLHVFPLKIKP